MWWNRACSTIPSKWEAENTVEEGGDEAKGNCRRNVTTCFSCRSFICKSIYISMRCLICLIL